MKREPYPSTLYVTIKGIRPPRDVEPALMRSMFATQEVSFLFVSTHPFGHDYSEITLRIQTWLFTSCMEGHKEFLVSCFFQEVGSRTYTDLKKSTQWGEKKKYVHNPELSNLPTFIFHANKRIFYVSCQIKLNFMTFIL